METEVTPGDEAKAKLIFAPTFPLVRDGKFAPEMDSWTGPPVDLREALQNAKEVIRRQSLVRTWAKLEAGCSDGHTYRADTRNLRRIRLLRGKWRVTTKGVRYHENEFVWWICRMFYRIAWERKSEFIPCPECGKPTDRFRTVSCKVESGQHTEAPCPWIMLPQKEKK